MNHPNEKAMETGSNRAEKTDAHHAPTANFQTEVVALLRQIVEALAEIDGSLANIGGKLDEIHGRMS